MRLDLDRAAACVTRENARIASKIGIAVADRVTTVKPAGTTSLVLGTSSGVHPWHNQHYIRRLRINKEEPIYAYLAKKHPSIVEDERMNPSRTAVLSFPQRAPAGAILRTEPALELLNRVRDLHKRWILPGHRTGDNSNNVSTTVSVRPHEWDSVGKWMWANRDSYNGLCVLPYSEHTYAQAPFEDCTAEEYRALIDKVGSIDLMEVEDKTDLTSFRMAVACSGQGCDLV